ncbi:UNVERIFIED_CONTAM: hypothetical protein NCL1_30108 [Trichonephila clavipes]
MSSSVANYLPRIGSLILEMRSKSQGQIKFTFTFHRISPSENWLSRCKRAAQNGLLPSHTTLTRLTSLRYYQLSQSHLFCIYLRYGTYQANRYSE